MNRLNKKWLIVLLMVVLVGAAGARVASAVGTAVPVPPPSIPLPDVCIGDDETPPVLTMARTLSLNATSPGGAVAILAVSAVDNCGAVTIVQSLPSGVVLPVGDSPVFAVAIDLAGHQTFGLMMVHVAGVPEQLVALGAAVIGVGNGTSLADQVVEVQASDTLYRTCHRLEILAARIRRQTPDKISVALATSLLAEANRVQSAAGCDAISYVDGSE